LMASSSSAVASSPELTQLPISPAAIRTGSGAGVAEGTGVSEGADVAGVVGVADRAAVTEAGDVLEASGSIVGLVLVGLGKTGTTALVVGVGTAAPGLVHAAARAAKVAASQSRRRI